jgi:hypothetical protein
MAGLVFCILMVLGLLALTIPFRKRSQKPWERKVLTMVDAVRSMGKERDDDGMGP